MMNITLTSDLEALVNEKVQSGLYDSPSDVVREGLRLLKEQDQLEELRREELRKDIMQGIQDIHEGRYTTYQSGAEFAEEIINEMQEELKRRDGK